MITAVDTSVLLAIVKAEPDAHAWTNLLSRAQADGDLVACEVVAAELFAALMDREKFDLTFSGLGIVFSPTSLESAQLAGQLFRQYRNQGGPREHLVPDFLIGAHALRQANQIAAVDRGYLRRYFPGLKVLKSR